MDNLRQNNYPTKLINKIVNDVIYKTSIIETTKDHPINIEPENNNTSCLAASNAQTTSIHLQQISQPEKNAYLMTSYKTPATSINMSQTIATSTTNIGITKQPPNNSTPPIPNTTILPKENLPTVAYFSIPYIQHLSENIRKTLKINEENIKITYRTCKTTNSLFPSVKDPVNKLHQHNIIYSIPCTQCPKVYIGMTTNKLSVRVSGHNSDINKYLNLTNTTQDDMNNDVERMKQKTALMQHTIEMKHMFDLTQTSVIDRTRRSSALPVLEICHIATNNNAVNHRKDVDGLSAIYGGILSAINSTHSTRKEKTIAVPINFTTIDNNSVLKLTT